MDECPTKTSFEVDAVGQFGVNGKIVSTDGESGHKGYGTIVAACLLIRRGRTAGRVCLLAFGLLAFEVSLGLGFPFVMLVG